MTGESGERPPRSLVGSVVGLALLLWGLFLLIGGGIGISGEETVAGVLILVGGAVTVAAAVVMFRGPPRMGRLPRGGVATVLTIIGIALLTAGSATQNPAPTSPPAELAAALDRTATSTPNRLLMTATTMVEQVLRRATSTAA
jgi:hypothetical protein